MLDGGAGDDWVVFDYEQAIGDLTINLQDPTRWKQNADGTWASGTGDGFIYQRIWADLDGDGIGASSFDADDEYDYFTAIESFTITGGAGADEIDGGAGVDTVSYAASDEAVQVNLHTGVATGGHAEGDTLSNIENLIGSAYADTLFGDANDNVFDGGDGADELRGGRGNDVLNGGADNDVLRGGLGDDTIEGGAGADAIDGSYGGSDTASYAASDENVQVDLFANTATGGHAQGDTLSNIENLIGSAHDDTLTGDDNDNVIEGGAGGDTIDGGAGVDTASYASSSERVVVRLQSIVDVDGVAWQVRWDSENITLGASAANHYVIAHDSDGDGVWEVETLALRPSGRYIELGRLDATGAAWATATHSYNFSINAAGDGLFITRDDNVGGHEAGDSLANIENLIGSRFDDALFGDDNDNVIEGGAGADTISAGDGSIRLPMLLPMRLSKLTFPPAVATGGHAEGDGLHSIENLIGSRFDDTLTGNAHGNVLTGGAGNDTLRGGRGNDVLDGGAGVDTVSYASSTINWREESGLSVDLSTGLVAGGHATGDTLVSIENIIGSGYDDVLTGDYNDNVITGGDGDDTIEGGAGADTIEGGADNDLLRGGAGADTIDGGAGVDTASYAASDVRVVVYLSGAGGAGGHAEGDRLTNIENLIGSAHNDYLDGDDNDNVIEGGASDDTIDGGAGVDTASYAASDAGVQVDLSDGAAESGGHAQGDTLRNIENLIGSAYDDMLTGDDNDNVIEGGAGFNTIYGNGGDDTIDGGAGYDNIYGGAGVDTASYAASDAAVQVNLSTGLGAGGHAELDTLSNIENLIGSAYADTLFGDANDNVFDGGDGADELRGGRGNDVLNGGRGNDVLRGGAGVDTIEGGAGADAIDGAGADRIDPVAGADTASYDASDAAVQVDLSDGAAESGGHAEGDTLSNIANLIGSAHADRLIGDDNDNVIEGGGGADTIDGNGGVDTASYAASDAGVTIDLLADTATGGHATGDTLTRIANLIGSAYDDVLTGDANDNVITGGAGNDIIDGGAGDDRAVFDYAQAIGTVIFSGPSLLWKQNADGTWASGTGDGFIYQRIWADLDGDSIGASSFDADDEYDYFTAIETFTITGGAGADALTGGAGVDTVSYAASDAGVTISLSGAAGSGGHATGDRLTNIENLIGSAYDDTLTGDANDNVIEGGDGADTIDGGAGVDTVSYASSDAAVQVGLRFATQSSGHAQLDRLSNIENLIGSRFDDVLIGDGNANVLEGGDGDDELRGGRGNDRLTGGAGNDTLRGGEGNDVLDGGAEVDTASYAASDAAVTIDLSTSSLSGGHATGDRLSNIENLIGSRYADTLTGDDGDNVLEGGVGADRIDGGDGVDTASYAFSGGGVAIGLSDGAVESGGHAEGDRLANIENLIGSAHNDSLAGDANDNVIEGGAGGDDIRGGAGIDTASYASSDAGVTVSLHSIVDIRAIHWGAALQINFQSTTLSLLTNRANHRVFARDFDADGVYVIETSLYGSGFVLGQLDATGRAWRPGDESRSANVYIRGNLLLVSGLNLGGGDATEDSLRDIENLIGSAYADTLYGDDGDNVIEGGAGGDDILGGAGIDTASYASSDAAVQVNLSNGSLSGGHAEGDHLAYIENLIGSRFDDVLIGDANDNVFEGGAGADRIIGYGGVDTASYASSDAGVQVDLSANTATGGHATGDRLTNIENLIGSAYDDVLTGDDNGNSIDGGAGNDTLRGGRGNDVLDGGAGIDTASYASSNAAVQVNLHTGVGNGGRAQGDTLTNIENLIGSAYDDTLTSDANDNVFYGGAGVDTASYTHSTAAVQVDLSDGAVESGGHAEGDTLSNIENLIGSGYDDTLTGDANDNVLEGGAGADEIDGGAGVDTASYEGSGAGVTIDLSANEATGGHATSDSLTGIENLIGSAHNDWLFGDANDNVITGGAGADIISGGAGVDTASYATSDAAVQVDLSANTATGGHAQGDSLTNIENLIGSGYDDTLTGDDNDNVLVGGAGADAITGGAGFDTASYAASDAAVTIGLSGAAGSGGHAQGDTLANIENLIGSAHGDTLTGDANANVLEGGRGADTLRGGEGADELRGGANNDVIEGGAGADVIDGGGGLDTASYAASDVAVQVDLSDGAVESGGHATGDTLTRIANLIGSAYDDRLTGDNNANVITGGAGADTIDGGAGVDTASYAASDVAVQVDLSDGAVESGGHAAGDTLTRIANLIGSAYDDRLTGDNNANVITGGAGADAIDGGAGVDTASYAASDAAVTIDLLADTATGGHATGDVLVSIENIIGSAYDDTLTGDNNDNVIEGGAGVDTASYASSDAAVTIGLSGAAGSGGHAEGDTLSNIENLIGSDLDDTLTGDEFDNVIEGRAGADEIDGGDGVDTASYASSDEGVTVDLQSIVDVNGVAWQVNLAANAGITLNNTKSNHYVVASDLDGDGVWDIRTTASAPTGADIYLGQLNFSGTAWATTPLGHSVVIRATEVTPPPSPTYTYSLVVEGINLGGGDAEGDTLRNIDNLVGSAHNDWLFGDANDNVIEGGAGADRISGGLGVDTVSYASSDAGVQVSLFAGTATGGHAQGDWLAGIENFIGSDYDDTLTLNVTGDNVLDGGAGGSDTLDGGTTGSTESDTYVLRLRKDGTDTVTRFNGEDKIRVGLSQDDVTAINAATDSLAELYARADLTIDNSGADTNIAITNAVGNIMVLQGYTDALTFTDFDLVASSEII